MVTLLYFCISDAVRTAFMYTVHPIAQDGSLLSGWWWWWYTGSGIARWHCTAGGFIAICSATERPHNGELCDILGRSLCGGAAAAAVVSTKTVATVIMPTRSTVINAQSPIHQPPAAAISLPHAGSWRLEQLLQRLAESDSGFLSLYCTLVWCWSSEWWIKLIWCSFSVFSTIY